MQGSDHLGEMCVDWCEDVDWIQLPEDRVNLLGSIKCGEFPDQLSTISFP